MKTRTKFRAMIIVELFFMIVALCLYSRCVSAEKTAGSKLNNGIAEIKARNLNIRVSFGYKGYTKLNNNMPVNVNISNSGSDYKGIFRIAFRNSTKKPMIQRKFYVKKDSKVKLDFDIPVVFVNQQHTIVLCDEDEREIAHKDIKLDNIDDRSDIYVGVITKKATNLKYINNVLEGEEEGEIADRINGRVISLYEDELYDKTNLEMMDMLVIDDYKRVNFSDIMIKNIKKWIKHGGSLVLGDIGEDYINNNDDIINQFLCGKKAKVIYEKSDIPIIRKINIGKGNLILSSDDMELPETLWDSYGKYLVNLLYENLSDSKKYELKYGDYSIQTGDSSLNYIYDTLKVNSDDRLPNLKLYGIILIIYIVTAGPAVFFYYKKKGRTTRLWFIVPAISFVFSFIIYLLGTSTRVQNPFINYAAQIRLDASDDSHMTDVLFSITSTTNKKYAVSVNRKCSIVPTNLDVYYDSPEKYKSGYDYGVDTSSGKPRVIINSMTRFERTGYMMKYKSDVRGDIDVDLAQEDGKLHGTITSKLSHDMKECIIYYGGNIIKIDKIRSGESLDVDKIDKKNIFMSEDYNYEIEKQLAAVMGGHMEDTSMESDKRREYGIIEEYMAEKENDTPFFYGFISNDENDFQNIFPFSAYGSTGVCKDIEIKESIDGYEVIGSLEKYVEKYNENATNGYYVNYGENDLHITYKFPDKFNIRKIVYSPETAGGGEFTMKESDYTEEAFVGTAYVRDKVTGNMTKLFDSGTETVVDNVEQYLNKDGTLTLYYYIEDDNLYNVENYCLPKVKILGEYENQ